MSEMWSACPQVGDVQDGIETCDAADSSGVNGENITRASTTLPVSSQPTVVDVLDTHHAQWTPHLWNCRNHMHGAMSASFKRQWNTIYLQHHRPLCDCRRSNSPPTFLHFSSLLVPHTSVTSHSIHLLVTKQYTLYQKQELLRARRT